MGEEWSLDQVDLSDGLVDFFLFGREDFGNGDFNWDYVVAFLGAWPSVKESFALDYDLFAELGAWWNAHFFLFPVYRVDGLFAAQNSVQGRYLELGFDVVAFTHKLSVFADADFDQKVPFEVAFFTQFYRIAVADAFRDHDLLLYAFVLNAAPSATRTELLDFCALPIARVASSLHDERPLPHCLGPSSIARITLCRVGSRFALAAFACFALYCPSVFHRLR